jgi:hypothetical protein
MNEPGCPCPGLFRLTRKDEKGSQAVLIKPWLSQEDRQWHCPRALIYPMRAGMSIPTKDLPGCISVQFLVLEVSMLAGKICNLVLNSVGLGRIPFCCREPTSKAFI